VRSVFCPELILQNMDECNPSEPHSLHKCSVVMCALVSFSKGCWHPKMGFFIIIIIMDITNSSIFQFFMNINLLFINISNNFFQ
jgi:hypothetical protein